MEGGIAMTRCDHLFVSAWRYGMAILAMLATAPAHAAMWGSGDEDDYPVSLPPRDAGSRLVTRTLSPVRAGGSETTLSEGR